MHTALTVLAIWGLLISTFILAMIFRATDRPSRSREDLERAVASHGGIVVWVDYTTAEELAWRRALASARSDAATLVMLEQAFRADA